MIRQFPIPLILMSVPLISQNSPNPLMKGVAQFSISNAPFGIVCFNSNQEFHLSLKIKNGKVSKVTLNPHKILNESDFIRFFKNWKFTEDDDINLILKIIAVPEDGYFRVEYKAPNELTIYVQKTAPPRNPTPTSTP